MSEKRAARKYLLHYMEVANGEGFALDVQDEIMSIVDLIVEAAVEETCDMLTGIFTAALAAAGEKPCE